MEPSSIRRVRIEEMRFREEGGKQIKRKSIQCSAATYEKAERGSCASESE